MTAEKNIIPILSRSVAVLEYTAAHPGRVTQSELIAALKIPQATCYRIVATLVAAHWLDRSADRTYDIAPGVAAVGRKAELRLEKFRHLQPVLEHLARKVGYSVKFSIRDGADQLNVASAKAPWDVALTAAPGTRCPLDGGGSVATVILASLTAAERRAMLKSAPEKRRIDTAVAAFRRDGFSLNPASPRSGEKPAVDALSVPVTKKRRLAGVLTLLSMPGELARADLEPLVRELAAAAKFCGSNL